MKKANFSTEIQVNGVVREEVIPAVDLMIRGTRIDATVAMKPGEAFILKIGNDLLPKEGEKREWLQIRTMWLGWGAGQFQCDPGDVFEVAEPRDPEDAPFVFRSANSPEAKQQPPLMPEKEGLVTVVFDVGTLPPSRKGPQPVLEGWKPLSLDPVRQVEINILLVPAA